MQSSSHSRSYDLTREVLIEIRIFLDPESERVYLRNFVNQPVPRECYPSRGLGSGSQSEKNKPILLKHNGEPLAPALPPAVQDEAGLRDADRHQPLRPFLLHEVTRPRPPRPAIRSLTMAAAAAAAGGGWIAQPAAAADAGPGLQEPGGGRGLGRAPDGQGRRWL